MRANLPYLDDVMMAFWKLKRVYAFIFFLLCYLCTSKFAKVVRFLLSHFTPALCLNHTPTLPLKFPKSHYDVIQVGQFCAHAGTKKSKSILLWVRLRPLLCMRPSYTHWFNETIMQLIHVDGATWDLSHASPYPLHFTISPLHSSVINHVKMSRDKPWTWQSESSDKPWL